MLIVFVSISTRLCLIIVSNSKISVLKKKSQCEALFHLKLHSSLKIISLLCSIIIYGSLVEIMYIVLFSLFMN